MAQQQVMMVGLKSDAGLRRGELKLSVLSSAERLQRSFGTLLLCWLLAGVTLFIPLAHFFLVPLFVIAGPVLFFMRYKVTELKESVSGECPECAQAVVIELEATDKFPKWTYCPSCNKSVQLVYDAGTTK